MVIMAKPRYVCAICGDDFIDRAQHDRWLVAHEWRRKAHGYHKVEHVKGFGTTPWHVLPFLLRLDFLLDLGEGEYCLREPLYSVYRTLSQNWPVREGRYLWASTKGVQTWMERFAKDEEAASIFFMMKSSIPDSTELIDRLVDLFDLPKYWLKSPD